MFLSPHPAAARGAYRDRHGRGQRDAMDAGGAQDGRVAGGRAKARGPGLPTPRSSPAKHFARWRGLSKPGPRGDRAIRRKPSRRECRLFGVPV